MDGFLINGKTVAVYVEEEGRKRTAFANFDGGGQNRQAQQLHPRLDVVPTHNPKQTHDS
ncbi:hypothetical protein T06_13596 [Trichinella sp. T6]|nr:hypothetical protein T06_13596 [Trichinella sp. T6]